MRRVFVSGAILCILASLLFSVMYLRNSTPTVLLANESVRVTVAETAEERERGLSGLPGLAEDEGMLFVFPEDGVYSFWMKDMLFSIDILWISAELRVVHIERAVSPETYPAVFSSNAPARYVLELPAGWARERGVKVGDEVRVGDAL